MLPWKPLFVGIINTWLEHFFGKAAKRFFCLKKIHQISLNRKSKSSRAVYQNVAFSTRQKWQLTWESATSKKKIIGGLCAVILIAIVFPSFFHTIENRQGIVLNDWLLNWLPARDMSVPIFIIIWLMTALMLLRCIQHPTIFICFLWGYVLLCVSRMITITLVQLDPPSRLLELTDRLGNTFYGEKFVTKDLFYSGHTASLFLMFLCFKAKLDKVLAFTATVIIGIMLLIQHVHYTIDVVTAPVFVYCMNLLARKIVQE